jgi:hypothetical protein
MLVVVHVHVVDFAIDIPEVVMHPEPMQKILGKSPSEPTRDQEKQKLECGGGGQSCSQNQYSGDDSKNHDATDGCLKFFSFS